MLMLIRIYNELKAEAKCIMDKLVITPKESKTITMTIRIDKSLQDKYNDLAAKTNRSRNELISMALQYALEHMEIKDLT